MRDARLRRYDRLFAPVVLTLAALFLHAGQLSGLRPVWRDSTRMYVPAKHYLAELLKQGTLPQWWPFDSLGAPFLAQPMYSTFHPTTLLYALLPFWTAFTLQDVAGTWLALTGTYLLARELSQPRTAALVAAVLYGASGYLVSLGEHTFMKLAAGTMPLYGWALLVAARRGGAALVLPAFAMGLLLLAGDPQVAILSAGVGLALVAGSRHCRPKTLALAVLAPAAGGLVAAIQLVPSMLLLPNTERASGAFQVSAWSMGLDDLAAMAFPFRSRADTWISTTVFGVVGFSLAAAALTRWRRRGVVALVAIALVSTWLALGDAWGLNALLRHVLPFWGKLRYPMKSIVAAYLAWSLLAGAGFARLGRPRGRPAAVRLALGAALLATALFVGEFGRLPGIGALLATLVGLLAIVVLTRAPRLRASAAVIVIATALAFGEPVTVLVDASWWSESPAVQALRREGVGLFGPAFERFDDRPKVPMELFASDIASGGGDWTATSGFFDLPAVTIYQTGAASRVAEVLTPAGPETSLRVSRLFGAGVLLVRADEAARAGTVVQTFDDLGLSLVRPARSLARSYAVHRARMVPDAATAGRILRSPAFKPGREILLEGSAPRDDWSSRPDEPSVPAKVVARTNSRVDVESDQPWPGFVVLNEAWFPGWTAEVDGKPAPVLVANGAVRAVETEAGHHLVRFRYRTPGLLAGALVSLAATCALLVAAALLARRRNENAASPSGPAASPA